MHVYVPLPLSPILSQPQTTDLCIDCDSHNFHFIYISFKMGKAFRSLEGRNFTGKVIKRVLAPLSATNRNPIPLKNYVILCKIIPPFLPLSLGTHLGRSRSLNKGGYAMNGEGFNPPYLTR